MNKYNTELTINERLAIVETEVEQLIIATNKREVGQERILTELLDAKKVMQTVQGEIDKYKGFLGGIVFVMSCLSVFLYKFSGPLVKMLSK